MASTDAKAIPKKNTALRITFPIFDADGDLVTGATGLDSEVSIDGGTFADCTNEATEIATASGMYFLDLTSGEMNGDTIAIIVKTSSSGAKTTPIVLYTASANINDLALASALATVQADTDDIQTRLPAALVSGRMDSSVGAMATGVLTATAIAADAITAAKVADGTIDAATFAAGAITATAIATDAITAAKIAADAIGASELAADAVTEIQSGLATSAALATVQADTDDIQTRLPSALVGGKMDSHVNDIAASAITATSIATDAITAAKIAADAIGASELAADAVTEIQSGLATASALATVQSDTDDIQTRLPAALVSGRMDSSVGAMVAGVVTAAAVATGAIDADALATDAVTEIVNGVWDEAIAGHLTVGTTGKKLNDAAAAGTPPTAIQIADAVLTREISNVEGGTHTFRTLYGMISKLVNRVVSSGGSLTIYETNDTTPLVVQTLTRDASATPVVEVDTP